MARFQRSFFHALSMGFFCALLGLLLCLSPVSALAEQQHFGVNISQFARRFINVLSIYQARDDAIDFGSRTYEYNSSYGHAYKFDHCTLYVYTTADGMVYHFAVAFPATSFHYWEEASVLFQLVADEFSTLSLSELHPHLAAVGTSLPVGGSIPLPEHHYTLCYNALPSDFHDGELHYFVSLICQGAESISTSDPDPAPASATAAPIPLYTADWSYRSLARRPEDYIGQRISVRCEVTQVIGSRKDGYDLRVFHNGDYDEPFYVYIPADNTPDWNILEDDILIVYGIFAGDYTYETVLGSTATYPLIYGERVELAE